MSRPVIPLGDCTLLSRRNAMRYCGQLGEERFDREVAPRCRARYLGQERFYLRVDLDAWSEGLPVDRTGGTAQAAARPAGDDWEKFRNDLAKGKRHQDGPR